MRVGLEAHGSAAATVDFAEVLDFSGGEPAGIFLFVELLPPATSTMQCSESAFTTESADAMEAAGGFINLRVELAAGVQRGHDHLKRRLVLEFGVRIDGNAAAVIRDG